MKLFIMLMLVFYHGGTELGRPKSSKYMSFRFLGAREEESACSGRENEVYEQM
jgi:hypothetical protein